MKEKNKAVEKNPYLSARIEWNDRYASEINAKNTWKVFSYVSISLNAILIISLVFIATRSQFIPFALRINELGEPIKVEKVDPASSLDPKIVAAELAEFITNVRTVTTDGKLKKRMQEKVISYCSAQDGSTSLNTVNDFWKKNDPYEIAKIMNISVNVESVMPFKGSNTWQLQWSETAIVNGVEREKVNWSGFFEIGTKKLSTWDDVLKNPSGLYIKSISWSQLI